VRVRITAILLLLLGAGAVLVGASTAVATSPTPASVGTGKNDGPFVNGVLTDETNPAKPKPVPGVDVTVTDEKGKPVGSDTTDAKGEFSVAVGGSGTFIVKVDTDTLPPGTKLRNPDDVEHKVQVLGFDVTVQFPIGPDNRDVETTADRVPELVSNGLLFGLMLALASLGLSMVFGTTGLTNFAHGELITFGALATYAFNQTAGLPVITAGILAVIASGIFGYVQDAGFWRPLRRRGTGIIAMMIVSIGMAIFLRNLYQYIFGGETESYNQYTTQTSISWSPVPLTPAGLTTMVICVLVLVAVSIALQRTKTGKATRAVSDNPALASASGIDVDRVISVVWVVGTALAGLSGVLLGLTQQVEYQMGLKVLLLVFAAVTLGGLGTIWGAMLGSIVVGIFIEVSTVVIPPELKYVGALGILIVILLVRPQGILGRAERVG
jgi:branched-chain amino acid transport system permease protein